jgi:hypothetical protein
MERRAWRRQFVHVCPVLRHQRHRTSAGLRTRRRVGATGGSANATQVNSTVSVFVSDGGIDTSATVSSGFEFVSSGGAASATTVLVVVVETVFAGGLVSGAVISRGAAEIASGGVTSLRRSPQWRRRFAAFNKALLPILVCKDALAEGVPRPDVPRAVISPIALEATQTVA